MRVVICLLIGVLALLPGSFPRASTPEVQGDTLDFTTRTGQAIALRVSPIVVRADGRSDAPVRMELTLSQAHFRSVLFAGLPADTCVTNGAVEYTEPAPLADGASLGWRLAARLASWDGAEATLDVRIDRLAARLGFRWALAAPMPTRLVLREGEQRVVDAVTVSDRDCSAIQFTVTAAVNEPAPVRDAALSYDIWLMGDRNRPLHDTPFRTSGLQGQEVPFAFPALPLPGGRTGSEAVEVRAFIKGAIRGRARVDGGIDLIVRTSREIVSNGLGLGEGGQKRLRVVTGETVDLELPGIAGTLPGLDVQQVTAESPMAVRIRTTRSR